MDPGTLVALTVMAGAMASLIGTVLAPMVLMYLTGRERRREKLQDYERQDAIAAKADLVAAKLLENQRVNMARTDKVAHIARVSAAATPIPDASARAVGAHNSGWRSAKHSSSRHNRGISTGDDESAA